MKKKINNNNKKKRAMGNAKMVALGGWERSKAT